MKKIFFRIYDIRSSEQHQVNGNLLWFDRATLVDAINSPYRFEYNVLIERGESVDYFIHEYEPLKTDDGLVFYKRVNTPHVIHEGIFVGHSTKANVSNVMHEIATN